MPKGRAAVAISTGHGSFHLGDRTESRNECKHSISEVFTNSIGSSPGPNRSASGSAARSNLYNSPPGTAKLWCGQSAMGAESFGFVGTVAHGNCTAHHQRQPNCRARIGSLISPFWRSDPLRFRRQRDQRHHQDSRFAGNNGVRPPDYRSRSARQPTRTWADPFGGEQNRG